MQVSHLQLTIQNKSAAPVWMMSIFVSSLVDMLVWPETSARMFDMSSFLGQWNSSASFALPEPCKVIFPATKRDRELRVADIVWPISHNVSQSQFCMQDQQAGTGLAFQDSYFDSGPTPSSSSFSN